MQESVLVAKQYYKQISPAYVDFLHTNALEETHDIADASLFVMMALEETPWCVTSYRDPCAMCSCLGAKQGSVFIFARLHPQSQMDTHPCFKHLKRGAFCPTFPSYVLHHALNRVCHTTHQRIWLWGLAFHSRNAKRNFASIGFYAIICPSFGSQFE